MCIIILKGDSSTELGIHLREKDASALDPHLKSRYDERLFKKGVA
jgi:hypothetical protein